MSLDISLYRINTLECECWKIHKIKWSHIRDYNITHNLNKMAWEAWLYEVLRRPEEIWVKTWKQALPILKKWLAKLLKNPNKYKKYNPDNWRWSYEWLVKCVQKYIWELEEETYNGNDCIIEVSR